MRRCYEVNFYQKEGEEEEANSATLERVERRTGRGGERRRRRQSRKNMREGSSFPAKIIQGQSQTSK
jgi:hypothetical protein